jgi:hypothetical protein
VGLRPDTLGFDCSDPLRVAAFWADALHLELADPDPELSFVRDPSSRTAGLFFQPVPEPKVVKNRVHLDLRPPETMQREVARLQELGAREVRLVQEKSFWTVMADVEGNEFCVLSGPAEGAERDRPGMDSVVTDCADPQRVAEFWVRALDYRVDAVGGEGGTEIVGPRDGDPMLSFVRVPEEKTVKNRIHLDVRPSGSMAEVVARVAALGAATRELVRVEGSFWTVMGDVEGNEFCVLRGPEDGWVPDEL